MTFLELCKLTRKRAGIPGIGPTTVVGQSGELERVVDAVIEAYHDIQMAQTRWKWLRADFSFSMTIGQKDYTPAQAGIASRFLDWDERAMKIYDPAIGKSDEGKLGYLDFQVWWETYEQGVITNNRPQKWTVRPEDDVLLFGPPPDKAYTVSGFYWKGNQVLAADVDVPEMPNKQNEHQMIMHGAMMKYGAFEEAAATFDYHNEMYARFMARLEETQLEEVTVGEKPVGHVPAPSVTGGPLA